MTKILNLLVIALLITALSCKKFHKHGCIHDQIQHRIQPDGARLLQDAEAQHRHLQAIPWTPINIQYDTTSLKNMSTVWFTMVTTQFIPYVVNYFEQLIQVQSFGTNISIPSGFVCNSWTVPTAINVLADYLLIFTWQNSSLLPYVAFSSVCQQSSINNRPNTAQINLNMFFFTNPYSNSNLGSVTHEIIHALGFSQSMFPSWWNATTGAAQTSVLINTTIRGTPTLALNQPQVLLAAAQYFGCSTITALELENQGLSGSVGSHWDSRTMYDDIMVASAYPIYYFGQITAASLAATGWWHVTPSMINTTQWGRNEGCGFLNNLCILNGQAISSEFCVPTNLKGCSFDHFFKATCTNTNGTPAYSTWNYFNNNTLSFDPHTDNCPVFSSYTSGDCRNPANNQHIPAYTEVFGPSSRCFTGNFSNTLYHTYSNSPQMACFNSHCIYNFSSGLYTFEAIVGNSTITCPQFGGNINLTATVPGYLGTLICPPAQQVCVLPICPNLCNNAGQCIDGACACTNGSLKPDCS